MKSVSKLTLLALATLACSTSAFANSGVCRNARGNLVIYAPTGITSHAKTYRARFNGVKLMVTMESAFIAPGHYSVDVRRPYNGTPYAGEKIFDGDIVCTGY